ncbi:YoaK family protein [Streptomyces sp. NPDC091292]|uniref:YoaK family protein n=1 Tax=Streptomyces sp. NPDC091292 TaxID=3365991 RepID=UPI003809F58F
MATAVGGTDEPNEPNAPKHADPELRGLRLPLVLGALTVVSGLIDAVSYLGLGHVFTANMTGNVVVLGFAAAGAPGFSATHSLVSLGAFLIGSVVGGRGVLRFSEGSRRTWVRVALWCEAVLVALAAAVAFAAPDARGTVFALIALTALAMGLRNATVRKLGVTDMTTTVLTMALTGLAADSRLGGGDSTHALRRAGSALALLAGALLGAYLVLNHGLGLPLLVAAVIAAALALVTSGRL